MADQLKDIPCDGPQIEPELLIPQQDYEKCDTCATADELADGSVLSFPAGSETDFGKDNGNGDTSYVLSDDDITALENELTAIADDADAQDAADIESLTQCISNLNGMMDKLKLESDSVMQVSAQRGKLDELIDNLEPYAWYHERRIYYYKAFRDGIPGVQRATAVQAIFALIQLDNASNNYSTAIKFNTTYDWLPLFVPNSFNITSFVLKYKYMPDLIASGNPLIASFANGYYNYSTLPVATDYKLGGVLYDYYYNVIGDITKEFFNPEKLSNGISSYDPGIPGLSDQQKNSMYLNSQKEQYDAMVAGIYATKINPALNALKALFDILASYEMSHNGDSSYSALYVKYFNTIKAERNRLKKIEDDFKEKVKVNPEKPDDSPFVKDMKKNMACLGDMPAEGLAGPNDEIPEFDGDMADTFAYSDKGMNKDSPNYTKMCYWLKFAQKATLYGLMPFPDKEPKNPAGTSLRYWPVGLVIPTPAMLVKIPLPIVWIPITVISSKFATIVIFIGQNGILPCPYVLFLSKTGVKKFLVTLRGPSERFGYEPKDSDIGYPIKIRVPFASTFAQMPELIRQSMLSLNDSSIEPFDKFIGDIKKQISDSIDNCGVPKFNSVDKVKSKIKNGKEKVNPEERYLAVQSDVAAWIDTIKMPKVTLPKDTGRHKNEAGPAKAIKQMKDFLSKKYALPVPKIFDLKTKIMPKILELMNDPDVKVDISLLPPDMDIKTDEDWAKFKAFTAKTTNRLMKVFLPDAWQSNRPYMSGAAVSLGSVSYISVKNNNRGNKPNDRSDWWIRTDNLMKSKMMLPSISISNPLKCKQILAIPPVDLAYIAIVTNGFSSIKQILDKLEMNAVISMLGFSKFKSDSIMIAVYTVINNAIPSIPLPGDNFKFDFKTMYKQMVKDSIITDPPKFSLKSMKKPVVIDFNVIKPSLKGAVTGSMTGIFTALPINLLTNDSTGFPALSAIDLKVAVKNIILASIDDVAAPLKTPYDAMRVAYGISRFVGSEKSPMDSALDPIGIVKDKAKAATKSAIDNGVSPASSTLVVPPKALETAMVMLSNLSIIPYPAVGAAAALGGEPVTSVMRKLHPLLYDDDLPPWERLQLKNMLFVFFLDEFCHQGKMYGGFFENYLP